MGRAVVARGGGNDARGRECAARAKKSAFMRVDARFCASLPAGAAAASFCYAVGRESAPLPQRRLHAANRRRLSLRRPRQPCPRAARGERARLVRAKPVTLSGVFRPARRFSVRFLQAQDHARDDRLAGRACEGSRSRGPPRGAVSRRTGQQHGGARRHAYGAARFFKQANHRARRRFQARDRGDA